MEEPRDVLMEAIVLDELLLLGLEVGEGIEAINVSEQSTSRNTPRFPRGRLDPGNGSSGRIASARGSSQIGSERRGPNRELGIQG